MSLLLLSPGNLLGARVFGDGFGTFADSVLCQFAGQKKTDSSLNLPTRDGRTLVVVGQTRSLCSDTLENVVDKAVHDGHGFAGDSSVGMNLLQYFVDVNSIALLPLALLLLVSLGNVFLSFSSLLGGFATSFRRHDDNVTRTRFGVEMSQNRINGGSFILTECFTSERMSCVVLICDWLALEII